MIDPEVLSQVVPALLIIAGAIKSVFDFLSKRLNNKQKIKILEVENLELKIKLENLKHDMELIRAKGRLVYAEAKRYKLRAEKCEDSHKDKST